MVDETALALHRTGLQIGSNISIENFQRLMVLIQYQKELHAEKLATKNKQEKIIVCDRGIIDNKAYSGDELFFKMLEDYGMDLDNIIHSYDKVIYLDSMAQTYPDIFENTRDPQKLNRAIRLSISTLQDWETYIHDICRVEACSKLKTKLKEVRRIIKDANAKPNRQMLNIISDEDIIMNIKNVLAQENISYKISRNVLRTLAK